MKRQWGWLLNLAAGAIGLLSIGLLALWVRSYFVNDTFFSHQAPGTNVAADNVFVSSSRGRIMLAREIQGYQPVPVSLFERGLLKGWNHNTSPAIAFDLDAFQSRFNRLGIRVSVAHQVTASLVTDDATFIVIPIAYLAFCAAILPALWLMHWIRHRGNHDPGHCRVCGYDLRATPGRCPECGTAPESEALHDA